MRLRAAVSEGTEGVAGLRAANLLRRPSAQRARTCGKTENPDASDQSGNPTAVTLTHTESILSELNHPLLQHKPHPLSHLCSVLAPPPSPCWGCAPQSDLSDPSALSMDLSTTESPASLRQG
ncbi:hypothetical protein SKAU_G00300230 [Synaphobranchus kaupii]|uniref:Uncharacterized protein n=1 Tax=Synaphobranchus kaupii TaxID=118154 RepID=A0A9Q1EVL5_SYNKA|nr:hypothetical protein SKAU_G00300230 [Synaphobranchus kaupii]